MFGIAFDGRCIGIIRRRLNQFNLNQRQRTTLQIQGECCGDRGFIADWLTTVYTAGYLVRNGYTCTPLLQARESR